MSRIALSSSIAPTSCAMPPVGRPRSIAIDIVWRTRVPPPTPITILWRFLTSASSSTSGRIASLPRSKMLWPPIETSETSGKIWRSRSLLGLREDAAVLQRLAHQLRLDMRAAVAADELRHVALDDSAENDERRPSCGAFRESASCENHARAGRASSYRSRRPSPSPSSGRRTVCSAVMPLVVRRVERRVLGVRRAALRHTVERRGVDDDLRHRRGAGCDRSTEKYWIM